MKEWKLPLLLLLASITLGLACSVFGSPKIANGQICEPITVQNHTINVCVSESELASLREIATRTKKLENSVDSGTE
jgi:hypothetical protein